MARGKKQQSLKDKAIAIVADIEVIKERIAKDRDDLRSRIAAFNSIVESADNAIVALNAAKRNFDDAVDELSKFL